MAQAVRATRGSGGAPIPLGLIVPIALESAGWIAPTYAWSERGLEIEPTMAAFPPE